ncbi:hyaluronidase-3 isoform X1 [Solea solea]|uniref:hyaluronidase-3 isoform X1 n=1 Tax=Solea solea TaxID=90069 RepID=UPI00272A93B7|nr:hyaluronidase-3 isoform X1 [Solea solea]
MVLPHLPLYILLLSLSPHHCTSLSQSSTHGDPLLHTPLPSVTAAGPILEGRPFVVVWNIPTARCQERYDVHLNLGDFDIVENRRQRFQGQRMTIFYRDRLGLYPYLSQDGREVNGGIPQLGDLAAHLSLTGMQMSSSLQPNFTGLGVIDWEEWQPIWEKNFGAKMEYRRLSKELVKRNSPDLSDRAVTSLARQEFEESAQKFMEDTLQLAVSHHPKGLWGFYGFPVCFNKHKRKTDESYTGRCHRGTRQQDDRLSWLWRQSTALYPNIYLPQRGVTDATLMVRHRVLEALRVASLWRHSSNTNHSTPVLPYARLAFRHTLNFLNKTDLVHTIGESASLGAAGVVLWGELKFAKSKNQCILLRDYVGTVLGPFIRTLRSDTLHCSLQLCHGNGRCTRRRRNSGHMVSLGQAIITDPHDFTSNKPFYGHFKCHCYPGWTGQKCQVLVKDETT